MKPRLIFRSKQTLVLVIAFAAALAQALDIRSLEPYYGAVVIDADTGDILKEDHAAAVCYPASMVKMMNLFVVLDDIEAGRISLADPVTVSHEVALIGGRQVWLKEGEVFPVEELIYAMMVHSGNDAATALAVHASATKEAHARRMTQKARELGLTKTEFHNVHGLPPSSGQEPDVSTPLEMALIGKALIDAHPEALVYTGTRLRTFRPENPLNMVNSNKLLGTVPGCDGLKTGYFYAGGFSLTATAERNGRRVITVIMGAKQSKVRDAKAAEWIEEGFRLLKPLPEPEPVQSLAEETYPDDAPQQPSNVADQSDSPETRDWLMPVFIGLPVVLGTVLAVAWTLRSRKNKPLSF